MTIEYRRAGRNTPLAEKVWKRITKTDSCWLWTGSRTDGYGNMKHQGRGVLVHRVIYELLVGPIPGGLQLDHLCRVRNCVNPAHLEPVTPSENVRRGIAPAAANAAKTHCPRGHEYDEANTYRTGNHRECHACRTKKGLAQYLAQRKVAE